MKPLIEAMLMMRPCAALEHRAADDLGAEEAMCQIEIDELLPGRKVGILDRDIEIASADIVDEYVDRPRFFDDALAEILARRRDRRCRRRKVQAWRPRLRTSSAVLARASGSRAFSTMSAPASAEASAMTRPNPLLPPVMKSALARRAGSDRARLRLVYCIVSTKR